MNNDSKTILTINAGSSSIKFAVFELDDKFQKTISGKIDRIGFEDASLNIKENNSPDNAAKKIHASDLHGATLSLIDWLEQQRWFHKVQAIGHRIVHGMKHTEAEMLTDDLLKELYDIRDYDPDHLPAEIEIVQILKEKYPGVFQVACFDTAFHTAIPDVAKTFAIPKSYYNEGIQRYGFHGISYSYLIKKLRKHDEGTANGKVILAHLGNGASLAALKKGKCIDTTMGFTPAGGIVMSTRSGDIDPGVAWYLMQKGMSAEHFNDLFNHQSGLLGISGISADMQDLLEHEKNSKDAALAIEIFCYQVKKHIGCYTAALGGLDALVFSGGIGENAPAIRSRICNGLDYLGIQLNEEKNYKNEFQLSKDGSVVRIYVIPTNEELMIAKITADLYKKEIKE